MLKKAFILASSALLLNAATTMCYKKNHFDPDTIETIPLKGGKCDGVFSVEKMKELGYTVKDIKISDGDSGLNYMYILEKEDIMDKAFIEGKAMSKEDLKAYINEIKQEEEIQKEKEMIQANLEEGEQLYIQHCQECHGKKAETPAYNTRPLINMSKIDIEVAMRDYDINESKSPYALLMKPYATIVNESQLENIIAYIQTLK